MSPLRHRTPFAAAVLAVGLLATACASDGGTADTESSPVTSASLPDEPVSTDGATTEPTADDATAAPEAVPEALQFTAPLVGGGEFTGADYADKPTVFWFWAPT